MATRLALVACKDAIEGPWTLARGNERAIKIGHLLNGERILLVAQIGDLNHQEEYTVPGTFPLPLKRMERYRVIKQVDEGLSGSPTTVEVILDAP